MIMVSEGVILKDVYDRFLSTNLDKKVYVYQNLGLTTEQLSHFCVRIYIPLLSETFTDLQYQDIPNIAI